MQSIAMVTLSFLFLLLLPLATAQTARFCGDGIWDSYTSKKAYQANLRLLSSTLPMKAASNTTLFATHTIGDAPGNIFALTLCRGDMNASECERCVATAFEDGPRLCPYKDDDVTLFYDTCLLRFSNNNFLTATDNSAVILMTNQNFTTSVDSIRPLLFTLINNTAQVAAGSIRRFATSSLDVSALTRMYCLMQCRPDLTTDECTVCFEVVLQDTLGYTDYKLGAQGLGIRCTMRYEVFPFFRGDPMLRIINNTPAGSMSPAGTPTQNPVVQTSVEHRGKVNLHDQAATNRMEEDALVWRLEEKSSEFTLFDFSEILHATCNFSNENLLGRGGFGPVYKGQSPGGMEIAVKRLASHSGQGFTEFKNEVELIAKLQHNNLVKLLGCCIQGEEKVLVYEYLPNKSLDFFIFDGNRTTLVDWNKRRVIIEGIAQGLLYLHKHSRLRIIHRDLKASNILLDQDMNPKISDFGLAKIFSSNDTQGTTKRVVGTYGYMSPEYASEGIYSIKSDVFSFGVLLLEILSGKRNSGFHQYGDFINLLGYSWQLWEGGIWIELLESSIAKEIHITEAKSNNDVTITAEPDGR
ncbi:cysteine-rich receptor-like protein kinase 10 [Lolium rigidum]|uniref:cysteine-rich receptor-like protein kinase 10 n=1 Tax=Lolium rigidum TaxID=89674 RepID=UPI001F5C447A|nr:cysteine-rich receptor-like protein kinase 10 [Lolium rigidum]